VNTTPSDSPDRARYLNNLGNGLRDRYARSGRLEDLEAAVEAYREAVNTTPSDSPDRARYLNNLGNGLRDRYARSGRLEDLEAAVEAFRNACELGLEASLESAFIGARGWGKWALQRCAWEEAAEAYSFVSKAIERLLEVQLLRTAKESWLREAQGLSANGAYALARTGDLERAIEIVEGGQARLLAEALEHNRQDLMQLSARGHGELLARYRQAASRWAELTSEAEQPSAALPTGVALRAARAEARAELDTVVEHVRQVPGYKDFLRTPTFARIHAAAENAPLAYILATPAGGLALIVRAGRPDPRETADVQAVWLDELTETAVREKMQGPADTPQLGGYLGAYVRWRAEPHDENARAHWFNALKTTTRWLWDGLMGPLVEALGPLKEPQIPSVVLIPTGLLGLLPLHAAWTEAEAARTDRRYALDVASFRYAPSARALAAAQVLAGRATTDRLLLCVEPQPVSASPLPAVDWEAMQILQYWPKGTYTDRWNVAANREELVAQLPEHSCMHFSGHAFAGWSEPARGGLLLAFDQVLTVKELAAMRLTMRLAVLSACETGVPGIQLPDEVIGLPSALMESGVAGVIASLWSVADESTARLMAHFHRLWREDGLAPHEALRRAQIMLRDESYANPFFWGAFTYTGI
jgi:hypothetical protein